MYLHPAPQAPIWSGFNEAIEVREKPIFNWFCCAYLILFQLKLSAKDLYVA